MDFQSYRCSHVVRTGRSLYCKALWEKYEEYCMLAGIVASKPQHLTKWISKHQLRQEVLKARAHGREVFDNAHPGKRNGWTAYDCLKSYEVLLQTVYGEKVKEKGDRWNKLDSLLLGVKEQDADKDSSPYQSGKEGKSNTAFRDYQANYDSYPHITLGNDFKTG